MTKISSILVGLVCLSFLASCTFPSDGPQDENNRGNPPSQSGAFMGSGTRGDRPVRWPRDSSDATVQTVPVSDSGNNMAPPSQDWNQVIPSDSSTVSPVEIQTTSADISSTTTSSIQNSATPITTTKTVSYATPSHRGSTTTQFSVTTQDGLITAANATFQSGDHDDQKYQSAFARSISSAVIGKKTSEVNLDVIGGASLTTDAFEQFIKSI